MLAPPRPEFARRDGLHLAYQVAGVGPPDLVFVGGSFATTMAWEEHAASRGFRRLASFSRFVTYDQRGMGYSDPLDLADVPTLDDLVADLEVVLDAAGVQDPVLFGMHNGGAVAALYASRHGVQRLVLCNTWARLEHADDYPIGFPSEVLDELESRYRVELGGGPHLELLVPAVAGGREPAGGARVDEPQPGRGPLPDEPGLRHPRDPPQDRGPDARRAPRGEPNDPAALRALRGRRHPGCPAGARPRLGPDLPPQLLPRGDRRNRAHSSRARGRSSSTVW